MKQEQDLAAKIAAQTAKKTAKVESTAAKKIAAAEKAAEKKTAAAERKMLKRAQKAEKQAERLKAKVARTEKKAADRIAKAEMRAAKKSEHAANVAARQGGAEIAEAAEGGKKKKKKKLVLLLPVVAIVAAGAFFFFRGRNAEEPEVVLEPIEVPLSYSFGEEATVPALPVIGEDVVVYSEPVPPAPAEPSEDEGTAEAGANAEGEEGEEGAEGEENKKEEAEEEPKSTATRFRYENVQDPKGLMSAYAALLTQADAGFSAVDGDLFRTDLPDFEGRAASEGQEAVPAATSVHLARNGSSDSVYSLQLDWEETVCTVVVDTPKGRVRNPPSQSQSSPMGTGLTVDGFRRLSPSALGLPGASMDDYRVYVEDGMLLVYGNTCIRVSVYSQDSSTGTNEVAGRYFLSSDGQHLYRYDVANNVVEELEIPK